MSSGAAALPGSSFNARQLWMLLFVTVVWGLNWPVLKIGVSGYPPLSFRALSMWGGLPILWAVTVWLKVPLRVPRSDWPELVKLTLTNMLVWHVVAIVALQSLSSGRAAILGYTMPIFTALWGMALFGQRLTPRQQLGVGAAACGVGLLLWHEFARLAGRPEAAAGMLFAAAIWALGTQQLRHARSSAHTLALVWWMSVIATLVLSALAWGFERARWGLPPAEVWAAIAYNAVLIFGFAQPAWLLLARGLPPAASTLSTMMIPVLGTASGAWWLGETLHWQDGAALLLMGAAIASVVWPARPPAR